MKRYLILLIAAILAAVSCTTARYVPSEPHLNAEWVGRSHADIVRNFGVPSREASDGADGIILVYEEMYTTLETEEFMSTLTTTSKNHRTFKEFALDADGTCVHVRSNEEMVDGKKFSPLATLWLTANVLVLIKGISMCFE